MSEIKILIIRLSAIGDTIHTLPLAYNLRKNFPHAQIDWVVEQKAKNFIKDNPLINNCFIIKKKENFFQIINKLRKENYDVAIDTQQLFKSGIILGLSGAKTRLTLDKGREFSWIFANKIIKTENELFDKNFHVIKRNLIPLRFFGIDDKKAEIKFKIPQFKQEEENKISDILNLTDRTKKTIILAPATTWENKHICGKYWEKIATKFEDKANIILTGTKKDEEKFKNIFSKNKKIINLAGKTTLSELACLLAKSDIVVSLDSGTTHIAWATQHPYIISIFCATSINRTAPFGKNYFAIQSNSECSPCLKRNCKLKNKKNICCENIDIEKIIKKIEELI